VRNAHDISPAQFGSPKILRQTVWCDARDACALPVICEMLEMRKRREMREMREMRVIRLMRSVIMMRMLLFQ
jgi:hypothetical protein